MYYLFTSFCVRATLKKFHFPSYGKTLNFKSWPMDPRVFTVNMSSWRKGIRKKTLCTKNNAIGIHPEVLVFVQ